MSVLWWVLLFIGTLWAGILLIDRYYNLKKRGFEVAPGLIMWRTKRGLKFIDRVAKGHRRSWLTFGTMAAVVGTALMVFIFSMMVYNLIFILSRPQPAEAPAGVAIALPGLVPGLT
ncbi:MAG: hypothetical protein U9M97_02430, partial [Candidatus Hadarchaeota archaeon]|nr:hypothetical protein [Candidatus Hadarchaeota archaeon]